LLLRSSSKKIIISIFPFFLLIFTLVLLQITHNSFSLLDNEWTIRQFTLGMFIFFGLTIIPNLLHMNLYFINYKPVFQFNLTHHPSDIRSTHEFQIKNYWICSGCFGSFLGILLGELVFVGYFLNRSIFQEIFPVIFQIFGILFIILSYSRYVLTLKPKFRMIQHASLFLGLSLALIGSDMLFESALSMIVLLPTWVLFLIIRVQLSKLDHIPSSL